MDIFSEYFNLASMTTICGHGQRGDEEKSVHSEKLCYIFIFKASFKIKISL